MYILCHMFKTSDISFKYFNFVRPARWRYLFSSIRYRLPKSKIKTIKKTLGAMFIKLIAMTQFFLCLSSWNECYITELLLTTTPHLRNNADKIISQVLEIIGTMCFRLWKIIVYLDGFSRDFKPHYYQSIYIVNFIKDHFKLCVS